MSVIGKLKKDELILVAEELGLTIPEKAKIVELRDIIEKCDLYVSDIEYVQDIIDYVIEEKKSNVELAKMKISENETKLALEQVKLAQLNKELELAVIRKESSQNAEFEKIKLAQLEKELEIANVKKGSPPNTSLSTVNIEPEVNLENIIRSVKTLTISLPTKAESFNLFFKSLEKAFKTKNVPEEFKSEILLNILGERANNLMIYITEDELCNYDKLKHLILKEFQPTPQECYNNFKKAQKLNSESYVQFASRLNASFEYYCQLRNANDFKSVCELVVSDKIMSTLDRELLTHVNVKQGESFLKPHELGRECDIFLSSKGKFKNESNVTVRSSYGNENKRFDLNKQQRFNNFRGQRGASNVFFSEIKNEKCLLCKNNESHSLQFCPQFKGLSVNERVEFVKNNQICFKCLFSYCCVKKCRARNCLICKKPHHKLLHFQREFKSNQSPPTGPLSRPAEEPQTMLFNPSAAPFVPNNSGLSCQEIVATAFSHNKNKKCLLSTARVFIQDRYSNWHEGRALLDSGSEISLLNSRFLNKLQLKSNKINTLISCLNDTSMIVNGSVNAVISNKNKTFERELNMLVVKKITDFIPNTKFDVNVNFSEFVELADDRFNIPDKIDMLLGAEVFYELLKPEKVKVNNSQLLLQNTVFGYVVSGSLDPLNETKAHCGLVRDGDLNKTLQKFWEIENVSEEVTKSKENLICEEHYARTHFRNADGRYVVTIPLKDDPSCLGKSKEFALKRLRSLWTRLSQDNQYLKLYKEFLDEYLRLGHMKEIVEAQEPDVAYYATHHGILKLNKSSTKLRVVFNCSALTTNGLSFNTLQFNGGIIQEDLFSLMIGFRRYIYAMTADVKMMFRTILVNPDQHKLQRILWMENPNDPPKTFELQTVTYGTVSAPFLATRTLKQLSFDEENQFPLAAPVLRNKFYMDDVLCGAETLEEAKELQHQLISIMKKGGMDLHKWYANHHELSPCVEHKNYEFSSTIETKTLGVSWNPVRDCFSFKIEVELSSSYTKRAVLSTIARLFDPLGLIAPVVARAKIFLQKLWRLNIDWSDPLPTAEYNEWNQFLSKLECLNNIYIERLVVSQKATNVEIHGFADASERCYGAAIYCKSTNSAGDTKIRLITSKSKVTPIKSLTIPRLELCAAVLLSKLMMRTIKAIKISASAYLWTDSMIVLAWIQKEPIDLKTFVQNRVAAIQELTSIHQWGHVSSEQNPADILSRGVDPENLIHNELWFHGPPFLAENDYPIRPITVSNFSEEFTSELRNSKSDHLSDNIPVFKVTVHNSILNDILNCSNNYSKILYILSFVLRFIHNCKGGDDRRSGCLKGEEIEEAEILLIKFVQNFEFAGELKAMRAKGEVNHDSKVNNLSPFIDSAGIIRVGGRLKNSDMPFGKKFPILLPKAHKLSNLIVNYYHLKYLHAGPQQLLYQIRQRYWIVQGRQLCRKIVNSCVTCFRAKPTSLNQIMGNLPTDRVCKNFPFNVSGVDFCGPFFIKCGHKRKYTLNKIYVCIFICFVTKAIHLEIVSDLTSDAFIATLKRFFARRGKAAKMYSDNGKTFVGANRELKNFIKIVNGQNEQFSKFLVSEGVSWHFIPPRAPHFGGLWEAGVKSFKYYLRRVVGNLKLTYEEFLTITVQIECMLNSRPLVPLLEDTDEVEVLTPAHFLIGRQLTSVIEPDLTSLTENRLKTWQKITKHTQLIWKKWSLDYLNNMQQRNKWKFIKNEVKIGDVVILKEDNLPPCKWVLGKIIEIIRGNDDRVRVVVVKTSFGIFKRPITKLCLLPSNE